MTPTTDLSFFHLISNASLVVKFVMMALMTASFMSWTHIFKKVKEVKKARTAATEFEARFWSGRDMKSLYQEIAPVRDHAIGMEAIFESGFKEFSRMRKQSCNEAAAVVESTERAMKVALMREIDDLENNLPFLATVGSTSPYVGLFGTVWGIMNSFRALSGVQQATLGMVAPGIAEALIATAIGLFAAIPAVIAYNQFSTQTERLINHYEAFAGEFLTILQRQMHLEKGKTGIA